MNRMELGDARSLLAGGEPPGFPHRSTTSGVFMPRCERGFTAGFAAGSRRWAQAVQRLGSLIPPRSVECIALNRGYVLKMRGLNRGRSNRTRQLTKAGGWKVVEYQRTLLHGGSRSPQPLNPGATGTASDNGLGPEPGGWPCGWGGGRCSCSRSGSGRTIPQY